MERLTAPGCQRLFTSSWDSPNCRIAGWGAQVDLLSRLTEATEERDEAVEQAHREWQLAELLRQRLASSPGSQDATLAAEGGRLPSNLRSSRIGHLQSPQTKPPRQLQQSGQTSHRGSPARTGSAASEHLCSRHEAPQADLLQQPSCEMELGESDCSSTSTSGCASPALGTSTFSSTASVISQGALLPHWQQLARKQQHRQDEQPLKHDSVGGSLRGGASQRNQQNSDRLLGSRPSLDLRQEHSSREPVRRSESARRPLLRRPLSQQAAAPLHQDCDLLAEAQVFRRFIPFLMSFFSVGSPALTNWTISIHCLQQLHANVIGMIRPCAYGPVLASEGAC